MTKAFENYTLLAGSHGRRGSIWRGPDHLLIVEGNGVLFALGESYRRIDYENIQALSLVRTQRYAWLLVAFSAPLVLMAFILLMMALAGAEPSTIGGTTLLLGMPLLLVPFVLLVVHLARGRTVRCTLQTAVQNLRLRPLTREANAERVIAEITGLCGAFQEGIVPPVADSTAGAAAPAAAWEPWNGSPAVIVGGVLVLVWGIVLAGELFVPGAVYLLLDGFLGMTAMVAAVIALIFAMRHHSPTALQVALWVCSGLGLILAFASLIGFVVSGVMVDRSGGGNSTPMDAFQHLADLSLADTQPMGWLCVGAGILLGVLGLAIIPFGMRRQPASRPATPPVISP